MTVKHQVMSAYVINGRGSSLSLAVRFDNLDEEDAKNRGECILSRQDLKMLRGLILIAGLMGQAHDISHGLSEKLEQADIDLTVAETFVSSGLDKVEDFPRWPNFIRPATAQPMLNY